MKGYLRWHPTALPVVALTLFSLGAVLPAVAAPVPGGTLDPLTIPKYVTPLVIPPEMPKSTASPVPAADYDIAVRQFKQQILPGGIWGTTFPNPTGVGTIGPFPATTVWSYGRAADPLPDSSGIGGGAGIAPATNSSFNYPAFTIENTSALATKVRWINDLKDPATGNFLPHLFNVDQTLHWANPPTANCVMMPANRTDCETAVATPYAGPIPLVTHLHGAHVQPHSDGFPEAWWLPDASNIPAGYSIHGSKYGQADPANAIPGSAFFNYENTQPATTLWYHDHALGMTRLNVYAGPAGFWLIRGGANDTAAGILPGPAPSVSGGDPNFNVAVRNAIREIPLAIQDRSFNSDGSLFYPADRTFFDGFIGPFIGNAGFTLPYNPGPPPLGPSDIPGIWNPEAFFNTMVVNGTTWPKFEVAPARYRLRLLDGCNSRTLNLAMFVVSSLGADGLPGTADDVLGAEVPFYQIGAEQGFLPKVVKIVTGSTTTLPGDGTIPASVPAPDPAQALLMGPAERADVIVDFTGIANGTRIRMINTAPDSPFGGFPAIAADPATSGQVMDFIVDSTIVPVLPSDALTTPPQNLVLPAPAPLGATTYTRQVSLNELSSDQVCVEISAIDGTVLRTIFSTFAGDPNFLTNCTAAVNPPTMGGIVTPMGPRQAQLGVLTTDALGNVTAVPKRWGDPITETPALNSTEVWEIFNTTADAHPIHVHLVAFQVVDRQLLDPAALLLGNLVPSGLPIPPNPNELGYKDTVISYPGQITRIKAKFDIPGLYVWHCHIVEHEDNEMMRPFVVQVSTVDNTDPAFSTVGTWPTSSVVPGYSGTNYHYSAAGNGSNTATWTFTVGTPGFYTVSAKWTSNANRATNAKYTIRNNGTLLGTVTMNQQAGGGQFVGLGTFSLSGGTLTVTLSNAGANGYVVADAVQFVPTASIVIKDNGWTGFATSGTWSASSGVPGFYGTEYLYAGGVGVATKAASWTFNVPAAGNYTLEAIWTSGPNRATNAKYSIQNNGLTVGFVVKDQTAGGGTFQTLGTYQLNPGTVKVILNNQANGLVIADAMRMILP
jgi:FtsP/CotA-like multicopper oxidase with cupredoxin domain